LPPSFTASCILFSFCHDLLEERAHLKETPADLAEHYCRWPRYKEK